MCTSMAVYAVLLSVLVVGGWAEPLVDHNPTCASWLPKASIATRNRVCKPGGGCDCSCNDTCFAERVKQRKEERLKACCREVGVRPQCVPMCRYETTMNDIICNGLDCYNDLKRWIFCAADSNYTVPNEVCCRNHSLDEACLVLCGSVVPSVKELIAPKYLSCLGKANDILQCHSANLPEVSHYKERIPQFENEELPPSQKDFLTKIVQTMGCNKNKTTTTSEDH